jgi:hypothetical protein
VDDKPKNRVHKFRRGAYSQGALKQKSIKQFGRKKGLRLIPAKFLLVERIDVLLVKKFTILHAARLFITVLIKSLNYFLP